MNLDVTVDAKRSLVVVVGIAAATVALCLKAISETVWLAFVSPLIVGYGAVKSKEENTKLKNGNGKPPTYDEKVLAANKPTT